MKFIDKIVKNSKIIDEENLDKYLKSKLYFSDKKCINKWICSFVILRYLAFITFCCFSIIYILFITNIVYNNEPYSDCIFDCCNKKPTSYALPEPYFMDNCDKNETYSLFCKNNCNSKIDLSQTSYMSFIKQSLNITFYTTIILVVIILIMSRYIPKIIKKYIKEITDQEKTLLDKSLIKTVIQYEGDYGSSGGGGGRESLSSLTSN